MPTLEQIQEKMKKLQAQAESLIAKRAQSVLNDIRSLMEKHGLTTRDIESHVGVAKKRAGRPAGSTTKAASKKAAAKPALAAKSKLPAKYRNPKTGATWSGWARPPEWIKDVKDRSKFLIDPSADSAASDASVVKAVVKKAGAKKGAAKKVAAKKAAKKMAKSPTVTAAAEKVARAPKGSAKAPTSSAKTSAVKKVATKKAARKVAAKKASTSVRATNTPMQSSSEPVSAVSLAS